MKIQRIATKQTHYIPASATRPQGPFPPEVLAQNPVHYEYEHSDSLHEALDDVRMFRCKDCSDVLYEYELDEHFCEEEYEEEG